MSEPVLNRRSLLAAVPVAALGAGLLASPASACPRHKQAGRTKTICYVEVNNNDLANVAKYSLAESGAPVFDLGVIFAANINYDGTEATLYCNPQVQATLDDAAAQIRPLQRRGIKVLLSLLGNHQGAGVCNFPSRSAARAYAAKVAAVVNQYGLDGIDIDDEYADYGTNGTGQPNAFSFVYFVAELRRAMPDKVIHFYDYGPASSRTFYRDLRAGDYLDYASNAIYGTYDPPSVPGLTKPQLAAAAVDIASTPAATETALATRTVADGYGLYLTYDLENGDQHDQVSAFTVPLYGEAATYTA